MLASYADETGIGYLHGDVRLEYLTLICLEIIVVVDSKHFHVA